jgi:mRNA interferase MazF
MIKYSRGDIVLVHFIFTDESGGKRRPAVILSSEAYNNGREENVIAAITSTTDRILIGEHLIADWQKAGLLFPSVATGIIRTIKNNMIDRKLGCLMLTDMNAIEKQLQIIFGIC